MRATSEINLLLREYELPAVARVRQFFNSDRLEEPEAELSRRLYEKKIPIKPGERIAITCGSRGIDQYLPLLKTIVGYVREQKGRPFLVPSMGSHGGATAEGQRQVLKNYGITEESAGAPILSSMETVQIGTTKKGLGVYIDKNAFEADGIILFNRVKPHTSFRGRYESGLVKMLAIGLAKQKGAEATHFLRYENMAENILDVGTIALEKLSIRAGVSTIENGYGRLAELHVSRKDEILETEPEYLKRAFSKMARIALDEIDVLIVGKIGKEISGTGMDTNIIGRFHTKAASGGPRTVKLGVLNVSEKSEGNANGMGLADFIPEHMYRQIDFESTYINTLTSTEPNSSRIPMVLENDRSVFQACVKLCGRRRIDDVRMVIIPDTKHLEEVYMSRAAVEAAVCPVEMESGYGEIPFDADGNLELFNKK